MSDESDREIQLLGTMILAVYALLRRVCALLPIPIQLPDDGDGVLHAAEMVDAVARIVEVIADEPVDELLQAGVWGGSLHWLSAAHLFSRYLETGESMVALEARINIMTAHDGLHVVEDLLLADDPDA